MSQPVLNQQETKLAENIINIGLANACSAFSMLTNDRVTFKQPAFRSTKFLAAPPASGASLQLLFTPFIGDVLFESYLVITDPDAQRIAGTMLPAKMAAKPAMMQAALLELDNIISAAIATKMSDLLGKSVTGDVPRTYSKNHSEAKEYIEERINRFDTYFHCATRFKIVHTKATAEYIFLFKDDFEPVMQAIAQNNAQTASIAHQSQEARRFLG